MRAGTLGGKRAATLIVLAWGIVGCSGGGSGDEPTTTTADIRLAPEVEAFIDQVRLIPVAPADGETTSEPPWGGFDCEGLAEALAPTAGDPLALLAAAAEASDEEQELVSAAQINVADGLERCAAGDMQAAAHFFASAAAAIEMLEDGGTP